MVGVFLDFGEGLGGLAPGVGNAGGAGDVVGVLFEEDRAVVGQSIDGGVIDDGVCARSPRKGCLLSAAIRRMAEEVLRFIVCLLNLLFGFDSGAAGLPLC